MIALERGSADQVARPPWPIATLRSARLHASDERASGAAQGPARGGVVLVVEDERMVREVLADVLRDEGFTVLEADNGRAALELLAQWRDAIGLILLDMRMPVMDGWAFAAEYRLLPEATAPIVVMTAASDAMAWGREISAAATLGKPFEIDQLIELVEHYLGGAAGRPSGGN